MKLLLFIFLNLPFFFIAQNNPDPVFILKPALGFNACQVHGDNFSGYNKPGIFAGAAVNGKVNEKLSFELGFYFSQKGARHNPNPAKGDIVSYRLNLNYIDIPFLMRYMVNPKYAITLGPSVAYLINHQEFENYVNKSDVYKYKSLEIGVNFGLGRKIKDKFYVEVRTSNSITAIRVIPNNLVYYNNPIARFFNKGYYNNILTLIISYKLDFKKKSGS